MGGQRKYDQVQIGMSGQRTAGGRIDRILVTAVPGAIQARPHTWQR